MPLFDYKAKNKKGKVVEGTIEAATEDTASDILTDKGLTVLLLIPKKVSFLGTSLKFLNKVSAQDITIFSRQLSVMVSANLPIVRALQTLIKQTENVNLKSVISDVADEVDGGAKLSEAMAKHTRVFSSFYVNMVKSGETSGRLDEVLNYLADQQEKDYDLMNKIKGAMIYPAFILTGLIVVGAVMMIFVVPKLTGILKEAGAALPTSTKILMAVSDFSVAYWWLILTLIIIIAVILKIYIGVSPLGRRQWDFLKIKVPVMGNLFQKIYLVRFTRSLNTLMAGGVPLAPALEIAADVVGNVIYKDLITETVREVRDGSSIASVFLKSSIVPVMLSQMLTTGEQTGRLEEILEKMSGFYDREIDNLVENLISLIEPIIMIVMGVAVGLMVAAIILPMYNLAAQF